MTRRWLLLLALLSGCAMRRAPIQWLGRVEVDARAAHFAWQGSGLVANVRGRTIWLRFRSENTLPVVIQAVVDGARLRFTLRGEGVQRVLLARGLEDVSHRVELYRDTEAQYGITSFLGFEGAQLGPLPRVYERNIEVVGDSISAGYGNLGSETHPPAGPRSGCAWSAESSSWYETYAAIAGRVLHANVLSIARSGGHMVPAVAPDGNLELPSLYEGALGPTSSRTMRQTHELSAVVINLGTNDWGGGDPGPLYAQRYLRFLQRLRDANPNAWIFLTIGPMLRAPQRTLVRARLTEISATWGDARGSVFDFGTQDIGDQSGASTGCAYHPSAAEHRRMAEILVRELREKLGW